MQERWKQVSFAPEYFVSTQGRVEKNGHLITIGHVTDGSLSAVLRLESGSRPYLVRRLVAEAFCEKLTANCDSVIHLDGEKDNCNVENLAWRPRWFAWKYTRQFHEPVRSRWMYPVRIVQTGEEFGSLIEAGMRLGMLWADIYRSTIEHRVTYPFGYEFEWV